ncbi:MAG: hypothetical protein OXF02_01560 [Simkaniaceae bacterium]|nr:hypothetical protein [Simkaniaceae bacterium]
MPKSYDKSGRSFREHGWPVRVLFCLLFGAFLTYSYIDGLNEITKLGIILPKRKAEVRSLREINEESALRIDRIEHYGDLLHTLELPEFGSFGQPSQVTEIEIE